MTDLHSLTLHLDQLSALPESTLDMWHKAAAKALKSDDLSRLDSITRDGIAVHALNLPAADAHSMPAALATRKPGRQWSIVQRIDQDDPDTAAATLGEDLNGGATAIEMVLSPMPAASAEEKRQYISQYLSRVFDSLILDAIDIHLSCAESNDIVIKSLGDLAHAKRTPQGQINVHRGQDPALLCLKDTDSLASYKTLAIKFLGPQAGDFAGCKLAFLGPEWHNGGATDAQEVAIALGSGVEALRAAASLGLDLAQTAATIEFRIVADAGQFTTIAKFRAFRLLWALVLEETGLAPAPAFVHAVTSWRMMSRRDPWVNALRTTVATFGAGIGGADAVSVMPHSAPLGIPNRDARRLARNIQTVLQEESRLSVVADPAAGSAGIEALTDAFAEKAWELFRETEAEGGLIASVKSGGITGRIRAARDARMKDVARRREKITGASMYPLLGETLPDVLGPPLQAARSPLAAILPPQRTAEPWEALRDRADAHEAATGAPPAVFLANLGPVSAFTVRATWMKNLLEAGGILAANQPGFADPEALAAAFRASGLQIAVLCSNDAYCAAMGPGAARALKAAGAAYVALAGRPGELEPALSAAGTDAFIYDGQDMLAVLDGLHARLGTPALQN